MVHQLEHITIENFKSLRHLKIKNLNCINLFIGTGVDLFTNNESFVYMDRINAES